MKKGPWRVIFLGTPQFAVPSLKALLQAGEDVVTVITQPDRPRGRGQRVTPSPVKELALPMACPSSSRCASRTRNSWPGSGTWRRSSW